MVPAGRLPHLLRIIGGGAALFLFCWLLLALPLHPGRFLRFEVGGRWDDLYLAGMHAPEQANGLSYRWTSREARVHLPPYQSPVLLTLRLVTAPLPAGQEVNLSVQVGGARPVPLPASKEMAVYAIVADTPELALTGWDVHLRAVGALQTEDDVREKSAALDWVQVRPLARQGFLLSAPLLLLPIALAVALLYAGLLRVHLPWPAALGLAAVVPVVGSLALWRSPTLGLLLLEQAAWPAFLVSLAGFLFLLVPWLAFLIPYLIVLPYTHIVTAPAMLPITLPVGVALAALAGLPLWWKRYWPAWLILGGTLWAVLRFHLPPDVLAFPAALLIPAIGLKERFGQHRGNRLAILCLALLAAMPALRSAMLDTTDHATHLLHLNALDESVRAGLLYPRWVSYLAYGYGSPLFNFYPPATRYLGEALHLLLNLDLLNALNLVYAIGLPLSGLGMYLLATDLFGRPEAALLSAAAYLYFPYHLADLFVRGVSAEALVLALLPFVFWSFGRLLERPGLPWAIASAALWGATILTHNATAIVLLPLLLAYLVLRAGRLWGWRGLWRVRPWAWSGGALVIGSGLSAFYAIPALLQTPLVMAGHLEGSPWDMARFWPPERLYGPWYDFFPLTFADIYSDAYFWKPNWAQFLLALIGLVWSWRQRTWRMELLFWSAVALLCLFLQTPWGRPIWEALPPLRLLQFPWRLLGLAGLATAPLIGSLATGRKNETRPGHSPILPLVLSLFLAVFFLPLQVWYPWRYGERGQTGALSITALGYGMPEDQTWHFLPTWTMPPELLRQGHRGVVRVEDAAPLPQVLSEEQTPSSLQARLRMPQAGTVRFNQTFFPGWQAEIDGRPVPVEQDPELGLVAVAVPAGEHTIRLRFADTPVQTAGWALTGVTIVGIVAAAVWQGFIRRKGPPAATLPPGNGAHPSQGVGPARHPAEKTSRDPLERDSQPDFPHLR